MPSVRLVYRREIPIGLGQAVLERLSIAWIEASGVRRSWLAHATICLRRRRAPPAGRHLVERRQLAGSRARAVLAAARADDADRSALRAADRAARRSAAATAALDAAPPTSRTVRSWPELNMTAPERRTAASGEKTERQAGELEPKGGSRRASSRRRGSRPRRRRRRRSRREAYPRPKPSEGSEGEMDRPRSSRVGGGRERSRFQYRGRFVAPDHPSAGRARRLAAGGARGTRAGRTPSPSVDLGPAFVTSRVARRSSRSPNVSLARQLDRRGDGAHSSELAREKGFRDVVVGAELEADDRSASHHGPSA